MLKALIRAIAFISFKDQKKRNADQGYSSADINPTKSKKPNSRPVNIKKVFASSSSGNQNIADLFNKISATAEKLSDLTSQCADSF